MPTRFRCLAWLLVLVFSAGLAAPAFASLPVGQPGASAATHVHADGSAHTHGASPALGNVREAAKTWPAKAPLHCPGCATAAECAVSCIGLAVLPTPVVMPASILPQAWISADLATSSGVAPVGDLDPPRPVSIH